MPTRSSIRKIVIIKISSSSNGIFIRNKYLKIIHQAEALGEIKTGRFRSLKKKKVSYLKTKNYSFGDLITVFNLRCVIANNKKLYTKSVNPSNFRLYRLFQSINLKLLTQDTYMNRIIKLEDLSY